MPRVSPLRPRHLEAGASLLPYGPEGTDVELVETFGPIELEYAAVRKYAAVLDRPDRGVIEITGDERHDFLNRMITRQLEGLEPGGVRRSFWLNRKGRIDADLRLVELGDRTLVDLDTHSVAHTIETLEAFIFAEDISLRDATPDLHRLTLTGPTAETLLEHLSLPCPAQQDRAEHADGFTVARDDTTGAPTYELFAPEPRAVELAERMAAAGTPADEQGDMPPVNAGGESTAHRVRLRQIGWHAYNIARIEAGTPLFMLDFGPSNLPAETGVLDDRVDFDKGCYLGQEVVARMYSLGKPKQTLVSCLLTGEHARTGEGQARQPITGAQVFKDGDAGGNVVGAITSSTISPMRGASAVCFAMVKTALAEPGTKLTVAAEGAMVTAEVQPTLRTLPD